MSYPRATMRRALRDFAAVLFFVLAIGNTARAERFADLEWHAPAGCASRDAVLVEVARLVARAPFEPFHVRAHVIREGAGFLVRIELAGAAEGVRVLQADSCESIARATALIVALAIDPQAALVASEQATERARPSVSTPGGDRDRSTARAIERRPPAALRRVAFLGVVSEHALLPGLAVGGEAGAGLRWRFVRGDMTVGVVPHATAALTGAPSVSGRFTLGFVAVRGCAGFVREIGVAFGCATIRGSRIWASGEGPSPSYDEVAHVVSFEPGLLLRVPGSTSIGAELAANLVVPASRPQFVIGASEGPLELFRAGVIGGVVKLALGFAF